MNKKTHKKYVALLTLLAMVICTMFCTNTAKADTDLPWDESEIAETSTCVVNGVERILIILSNNDMYLKVGNDNPIYVTNSPNHYKLDKYGTLWQTDSDNIVYWKSYDFGEIDESYGVVAINGSGNLFSMGKVESLIFDTNGQFVIGFKLASGDSYYTYTPDEIQSIVASDFSHYPALRLISSSGSTTPTPTPTNSASTLTPTPTPSNIPTPTPTVPAATPNVPTPPAPTVSPVVTPPTTSTPAVTPKTTVTPKVSVKKKAGYNCLSLGSKITSKYKLTKGKLTWKGSSKSKKYSGIKSAAFIKKSGNLVFMTKKGKVYTLSPKGKKKCIVKKKAKKLILKNKFAVKVKVGKKFINIANK